MKKYLVKILIAYVIILIIGVPVGLYYFDSLVESKVREFSKKQLEPQGIFFNFENISIGFSFPLKIAIDNLTLTEGSKTKISIDKVSAQIGMIDGYFKTNQFFPDIELNVLNPKISMVLTDSAKKPPQQTQAALPIYSLEEVSTRVPAIKNLRLKFAIENLNADINKPFSKFLSIKDSHIKVSFQNLQSPIILNITSSVKAENSPLPIWIPIELDSQLQLRQGILNSAQSDLKILAINTRSRGQIDFENKKLSLQVLAQIPALEKVPIPANLNLPFTSWKGSLNSKVNLNGPFDKTTLDGFIDLKGLLLNLNFKNETTQATGLVFGNVQSEFLTETKGISLKNTLADLDMTQLDFTQNNMIKKPKGIPFTLKTQLAYDQNLSLQSLAIKFAQIQATASGNINLSSSQSMPAQISFAIQPTNLSGLEKYFLPLSQYPLTGLLAAKVSINGDLKNAAQSKIQIDDLSLKNLSTKIKYAAPEMSLEGPITLNVESKLSIDKLAVNSGSASISSNLSGLKVKYKDMFAKNSGEPLTLNLNAVQKGRSLTLKTSQIQTSAGTLNFSGTPPISPSSPMSLQVDSNALNLTKLKTLLPSFQKTIPDGSASFTTNLNGRFDTNNFMKSPMSINLKMTANIPKYVMAKKESPQAPKNTPVPPSSESFLPNEPLLKQIKGSFNINISEFVMDNLKAEQVSVQSQLLGGTMTANANIKKVFGGEIKANNIRLNLLQNDPTIQFDVQSPNLKIEQALAWSMPQFQKMIAGSTQLKIQGSSKMPSSLEFMKNLNASGNFKMKSGLVNVATIADMAKGFTSKVPMLDVNKLLPSGPVPMKITSQFQIKDSQMRFNPFQALTAKKEEINVRGSVGLDLKTNMSGSLFLVDVGSNSSFIQANKDSSGRLEIPMQIQGFANKPEFKFADTTISKMTQKTIQFEKAKLTQKAKAQVNKEVQKQTDKLKDGLKDKLKDIFK